MIRIILTIGLLFFSIASFAEDYDEEIIFNEGAWKVAIWEFDEGGISCAAGLITDEKEFFIEINPEEGYSIFGFWYEDEDINSKLERMTFSVDKNESWYSSTPTIEDGSIYFYFRDADQKKLDVIYEQIKTGNKMYHWNDNKKLIAEFDLSGAISSIEMLKKCVQDI
tara:strand:- start:159 stop:659 length:501 start_codon:yes stop_codon:yes gene_type:complete